MNKSYWEERVRAETRWKKHLGYFLQEPGCLRGLHLPEGDSGTSTTTVTLLLQIGIYSIIVPPTILWSSCSQVLLFFNNFLPVGTAAAIPHLWRCLTFLPLRKTSSADLMMFKLSTTRGKVISFQLTRRRELCGRGLQRKRREKGLQRKR